MSPGREEEDFSQLVYGITGGTSRRARRREQERRDEIADPFSDPSTFGKKRGWWRRARQPEAERPQERSEGGRSERPEERPDQTAERAPDPERERPERSERAYRPVAERAPDPERERRRLAREEALAAREAPRRRPSRRPPDRLEVEDRISTVPESCDPAALRNPGERSIALLCRTPCAVAEVAARLTMPLTEARRMVTGMYARGILELHPNGVGSPQGCPDRMVMLRIRDGLRRL